MGSDLQSTAARLRAGTIGVDQTPDLLDRASATLSVASRRCSCAYENPADGKTGFVVGETIPYRHSVLVEADSEEASLALYQSLWDACCGGKAYEIEMPRCRLPACFP